MKVLFFQSKDGPPFILPASVPKPAILNTSESVIGWESLTFSPQGIYSLRSWLGTHDSIPNFFNEHQASFRASDIAFFTAGAHQDGTHTGHSQQYFHPSLKDFYRETTGYSGNKEERKDLLAELQAHLFDTATMLDRISGSTTMVIRSPGTTIPGSPARPEYLKAHVYLPPAFLRDNPDLHRILVDLVQQYIETVGVRTVQSWVECARHTLGYSLTQHASGYGPSPNPRSSSIPAPVPRSAHYIFLGQPQQIIETVVPVAAATVEHDTPLASQESYAVEDLDPEAHMYLDMTEKVYQLEQANLVIDQLEQANRTLTAEKQALLTERHSLLTALSQVQNMVSELEAKALNTRQPIIPTSRPTTPAVNPRTPVTLRTPVASRTPVTSPLRAPRTPVHMSSRSPNPVRATPSENQYARLNSPSHFSKADPPSPSFTHRRYKISPPTPTQSTSKAATLGDDSSDDGMAQDVGSALIQATLRLHDMQHLLDSVQTIILNCTEQERSEALHNLGLPPKVVKTVVALMNLSGKSVVRFSDIE